MSDSRRAIVSKALLEMVFVALGVFLAMAADQWRTDRQHQEQARAALQRFKAEIERNRDAVIREKDYHVKARADIITYIDPKSRATSQLDLQGIRPVPFEHTAWDLALATQTLADIDQQIAFELTQLYGLQQQYLGLSASILQAMYLRPPDGDSIAFLQSVKVFYDDVVGIEPKLLELYGRVLPLIDRAVKD